MAVKMDRLADRWAVDRWIDEKTIPAVCWAFLICFLVYSTAITI